MTKMDIGKRGETNDIGVKINHGLTGRGLSGKLAWQGVTVNPVTLLCFSAAFCLSVFVHIDGLIHYQRRLIIPFSQ
jgi:hypothetical protein